MCPLGSAIAEPEAPHKCGATVREPKTSFERIAAEMYARAHRALTSVGVRFFLACGTLLGWRRRCAALPGDVDIDLGIFREDWSWKVPLAMHRAGFDMVGRYGTAEEGNLATFGMNGTGWTGVVVDIFTFYELNATHLWLPTWDYDGIRHR